MWLKQKIKNILTKRRKKIFSKFQINKQDITILCNCCIGGAMYHDLGLQFKSPTINLYFAHHGFIDYINNLNDYIYRGELIESAEKEASNGAPIGFLTCEGCPQIEIHFLHYKTFDEAKEKWIKRTKRINLKKIFLVIEAKDQHEHSLIEEYSLLPYKKIIFTNLHSDCEKSVLHMRFMTNIQKATLHHLLAFRARKGMTVLILFTTFLIIRNGSGAEQLNG